MCVCGIGDEQHIANLGGKQRGTRAGPGGTWAGPGLDLGKKQLF